ncbi:uncharacterized protein [Macrobrachium rosenbergii]|uniref:uncharacterized protein n=1 Tax=Macrobrachium rosenbergii TaxID=79674 RepID=UPI0034D50571
MSLQRFRFLLRSMRFDDIITRAERRLEDKIAAFRKFFEKFVDNCISNYNISEYATVDEMLAAFRGKCPFRVYMPSKPAKYGIKIFILADAKTFYVSRINAYNIFMANSQTAIRCRKFLKELGLKLVEDHIQHRKTNPHLRKDLKRKIQHFSASKELPPKHHREDFIQRCSLCPRSKDQSPLTDVLRDNVHFVGGDGQQSAFQNIEDALVNLPVLKFPDFECPFTLVTDAGHDGRRVCLMQKFGGRLHPIAFYNRKFKTRGSNGRLWWLVDKEAFAVVSSLVPFKMLLMGNQVEVLTDHKPLLDLFNKLDLSLKRARHEVVKRLSLAGGRMELAGGRIEPARQIKRQTIWHDHLDLES